MNIKDLRRISRKTAILGLIAIYLLSVFYIVFVSNYDASKEEGFNKFVVREILNKTKFSDFEPKKEVVYSFLDEGNIKDADLILKDCWDFKRYDEPACFDEITWKEDPEDRYWRFLFYSLRETRHLLWAYRQTGDRDYRDELLEILDSYANYDDSNNQYFWDMHGASFRAMVLVNIYFKLKETNDIDANLKIKLEAKIRGLGNFLANPKNFEGDFNHGFTQASALLLIAENFSHWPEAQAWKEVSIKRFDEMFSYTIDEDGVEFEQSPYYHFYVLNFVYEIYGWAQANNIQLSEEVDEQFENMIRYANMIVMPNSEVPMMGASLKRDITKTQRNISDRIAQDYPEFEYVLTKGESGQKPSQKVALFPSSGQFIARSGYGSKDTFEDQTYLLFDTGGYRTLHSHFDALSLVLYSQGDLLLVDPGLYSYEESAEHDYFYGTTAHNTVSVDGEDQMIGPSYAATTIAEDDWVYQSAYHNLYEGVLHKRGVLVLDYNLLLVLDELESDSEHEYSQNWHLHPKMNVEVDSDKIDIKKDGQKVMNIYQNNGGLFQKTKGGLDPIKGWYSEEYWQMKASYMLEYIKTSKNANYETLFAFEDAVGNVSDFKVERSGDLVKIYVKTDNKEYDIEIQNFGMKGEEVVKVKSN